VLEIFSKKYCTFSYVGDLIPNGYIDTYMIPNILKVYDEIEKNQIFGTKEIKEILDCSPSTARVVMTKLRDMKVVKAVNDKGKGKYVFIE
jgi:Fic family protein